MEQDGVAQGGGWGGWVRGAWRGRTSRKSSYINIMKTYNPRETVGSRSLLPGQDHLKAGLTGYDTDV